MDSTKIELTTKAANDGNTLLAADLIMSEAISFKRWCDNGRAWYWDNLEEHTHTDEELYHLFKQERSQVCG